MKPDQVLGSSYFKEVLNTYSLLGFGYTMVMNDRHLVDLQKEMGVEIKDTSEVSLVVGNFLETVIGFPVSTSGNYQALHRRGRGHRRGIPGGICDRPGEDHIQCLAGDDL